MAIGNWGFDVVFTVSDQRIFTPQNLSRSIGSEWANHARAGQKDLAEYLKPSLQKITFDMTLDAANGVRPRAVLELLEDHCERGLVYPLIIGGRRVGKNRWRLTSVSEEWEVVYNDGILVRAKVRVTMEEYL